MNALDELQRMLDLFPSSPPLLASAEHVASATTPQPYRQMLVHEHHMTVTMEQYHGCPVDVVVLQRNLSGDVYSREIILTRSSDDVPVQFGIVRFNLEYVTRAVRDEIVSESTPLGRVLINHNVLRHIDLAAILRIQAGPRLAELLRIREGAATYGRLATIFCNNRPAVDLLEISSPLGNEMPTERFR